jgi:hypothetical protein
VSFHGWVFPVGGGTKARCGGPALCQHCRAEAQALEQLELVVRLAAKNGGHVEGRFTRDLDVEFTISFPPRGGEARGGVHGSSEEVHEADNDEG